MKIVKELSEVTCETTTVTVPLCTKDGRPIALLVGKSLSCVDVSKFIIYPIIYDDYKTSYIIPTGIDIYMLILVTVSISNHMYKIFLKILQYANLLTIIHMERIKYVSIIILYI